MIRQEPRSIPSACATDLILSSGPTSTGSINPRRAAWSGPSSESRSQGCTTAQATGEIASQARKRGAKPSPRRNSTCGGATSAYATDRLGAATVAVPFATVSPRWFVHRQSRTTSGASRLFWATLTDAVSSSPAVITPWNRRSWRRIVIPGPGNRVPRAAAMMAWAPTASVLLTSGRALTAPSPVRWNGSTSPETIARSSMSGWESTRRNSALAPTRISSKVTFLMFSMNDLPPTRCFDRYEDDVEAG